MSTQNNHGIIIRRLRVMSGLSVRKAAKNINRSIGWLSEVENNTGTARLGEAEFERIVAALDGNKHKKMFKTWIAQHQNKQRGDRTFDGAVLKYVRKKKGLTLSGASLVVGLSVGYLSKLESGRKPMTPEMRDLIMRGSNETRSDKVQMPLALPN